MKWKQSTVYSFLRRWMGNGSISKDWIIIQCTAVFFGSWKLYEIKQLRLIFFHQIFTHLETIRWGILDLNNSTVWNGRWFWVIGIGMDCCCIHRRKGCCLMKFKGLDEELTTPHWLEWYPIIIQEKFTSKGHFIPNCWIVCRGNWIIQWTEELKLTIEFPLPSLWMSNQRLKDCRRRSAFYKIMESAPLGNYVISINQKSEYRVANK